MSQPLAYVHPQAKIADNVVVEPFAFISKNVEIGEGSWIGPNSTIMPNTRIGKNCRIYPGAVIGASPQDLKFDGEETEVIIGNNTVIRECVTIHRGTKYAYKTIVGNNCLLMAYVHLAHDCNVGNNVILANSVGLAGHCEVGDWAILEGMVAVQQFIKIGQHAFIAGGSLVRKDVPPFVKAAREPLSYVGVNSIGLRRRGFSAENIQHIQDIYRMIFVRGYNISKALSLIEADMPTSDERDMIVTFIRNSKGGVMKSFRQSNE
ncbi:MAG: acyl-ACP--UDP-N-acetylglucosamine O-acyltransferase [Fimbriimonadaceae bacterium]|nr:acyl-ACP--UDP-N-acetylglucosamine O-acyltransferase [Chitinophagales bacterium]